MPAHHARSIEFPFWERAACLLALGLAPFALQLGATNLTGDLSLLGMHHTDIYLGPETALRSSGASSGTLASRAWGRGDDPLPACVAGKQYSRYFVCVFY